jgi:hypothetical protein
MPEAIINPRLRARAVLHGVACLSIPISIPLWRSAASSARIANYPLPISRKEASCEGSTLRWTDSRVAEPKVNELAGSRNANNGERRFAGERCVSGMYTSVAERSMRAQAAPFQSVEARRCLTGVCGGSIHHVWTEGLLLVVPLLHVPAPSGELAEEEFLGQARANAFSRADGKISEDQAGTTIGLGVVKVGEDPRTATNTSREIAEGRSVIERIKACIPMNSANRISASL